MALCGACVPARALAVRRLRIALSPVRVSWDRIIRTTVGLRPHRDSGFVLRAEKRGEQLLVHNYGHGGAGMSLAWGTASMAADLALQHEARHAAVIGCGAVGLATARELQRRGFHVTIYAAALPPDTTSNMSTAAFTPASGLIHADRRTPQWDAQFARAADLSYRHLQVLAGPTYGVSWIDSYTATPRRPAPPQDLPPAQPWAAAPDLLGPAEHPFPSRYVLRTRTLQIDPHRFLDALAGDVRLFGGRIIQRRLESAAELASLSAPVVINCTGLGTAALFQDAELIPVKGQLTLLEAQPEVTYRAGLRLPVAGAGTSAGITMTPRKDGIVLGNVQERGVWSLEPNVPLRDRIVAAAMRFFGAMDPVI